MFLRPWQVLQSRVFMFSAIQFNIDKNDSRAHECQLVFCTIISIYSFGSKELWRDIMNIKMCINQQQIFNNLYCWPAKTIFKGVFIWEKKCTAYGLGNRVPWLAGMILIFVYMRDFVSVCREECITCVLCSEFSSVWF